MSNLGESREVDGQQAGRGLLALVGSQNNRPILLEGDGGLVLVHHLQLGADCVEHDLAEKDAAVSPPRNWKTKPAAYTARSELWRRLAEDAAARPGEGDLQRRASWWT